MAYIDYKITNADLNGKKVTDQPDVLVGAPQANKQVFDNYPDVIKTKYNGLIDDLVANPPITPSSIFPVGAIIATSVHSAPTYLDGNWAEISGMTLSLTLGTSDINMYFYQRTA